jgi:GAF domain-containing protein
MTFDIPLDRPVGERQLELARIVADRLGQALENAQLVDQSSSQALRERKASEVSATLISATDVRAVLAIAAETFNEAMGAVATRVTLQPDMFETPRPDRREGVAP